MRNRARASGHDPVDVDHRQVIVVIDVEENGVMSPRGRPGVLEVRVNDRRVRRRRMVQVPWRKGTARQYSDTEDHDEGETNRPHRTILPET
jgi:hypothetical protein